jgi:hypothetical protein
MQRIFFTVALTLLVATVSAQYKTSITVVAKAKNDGIWLRWAPVDPTVWRLGNTHGYVVERFTLLGNGELENPLGERLSPVPLRPYTLAALGELSKTIKEADVLGELIYDEDLKKPVKANDPYSLLARNQDLENKYGVALLVCDLSTEVAKAAALFLVDHKAVKGKRYIYRVSVASSSVHTEPGVVVIDMTDEKPLIALKDLKADFRDKTVSLSWATLLHTGTYSSYYIEKSEDGKIFKRLSDLPYVHMSNQQESETAFFVDSLDTNNKMYYYRIAGISPFGETGPPSNVVSGKGRENLHGYIVIRQGKLLDDATGADTKGKKVKLTWEFPPEAEAHMSGFVVSKSGKAEGPYTDVTNTTLTKSVRDYTDITTLYNTYYIVKAVDESGNELSRSFPFLIQIEDSTPPEVPTGLTGSINEKGVTQLKWIANKDQDLMGYRVFRSNSLDEEFVEITKSLQAIPAYRDTINIKVLNRKVFYRVVAVDKNYNNSEYSLPLSLLKPDIIAPIAPVFTKAEIQKGTIVLKWSNSTSPDIAKVELVRLDKEDRVSRVIKTWQPSAVGDEHTELSLTPGKTYQYKIVVYDSSDNIAEGVSPQLYYETGFRNAVGNVKVVVDRDAREIKFEWNNSAPAVKCTIYRKKNDEPLILYKTIDGNVENFSDKNITINSNYTYKIQVTYAKGIKSLLTEELKVVY